MKRLETLPQIAERQLGGLEATPVILAKAKLEAAEMRSSRRGGMILKPVLAVCAALVLCVGAVAAFVSDDAPIVSPIPANVLDSHSAGMQTTPTEEPRILSNVPSGAISMSAGMRRSGDTLFADLGSATFPLITLDGATYRLLSSPDAISSALLGDAMGTVSEFNLEPALGSGGVVSNAVACGESVYAISGMDGALVAAQVDGALRVFQRVSYAGNAIIGSETLADTLCAPSEAAWIEVSGMGRVDDKQQVQELMNTLLDYADYTGTSLSGSISMRIGLSNGLTLQLLAGEDTVSACGTWSCPDFFEAFIEAAQ